MDRRSEWERTVNAGDVRVEPGDGEQYFIQEERYPQLDFITEDKKWKCGQSANQLHMGTILG